MKSLAGMVLALTLSATTAAHAWWDAGHMQIAWLAWQKLDAQTRLKADALLQLNPVAPPPATDPRVSMVIIATDRVATSLGRDRLNRAEAQRSGLSAFIHTLPGTGRAIADIDRSSKSP